MKTAKTATKARPRTVTGTLPNLDPPKTQALARLEVSALGEQMNPVQLLGMAVQSNASVEILERLYALKREWEKDEARKAFVVAMTSFKQAPPRIDKDKHVFFPTKGDGPDVDYHHATLGNVCEKVIDGLARVGISHRWEFDDGGEKIIVTCVLTHALGHEQRTTLRGAADVSGKKNALQQRQSTVTYLERYTLLGAVGLATYDDNDGGGPEEVERVNDEQLKNLQELVKESASDEKLFCAYMGDLCKVPVASLDQIPANRYIDAVRTLESASKARKRQTAGART